MIIEMSKSEIRKQERTFDNLNKFINRYRSYIKCTKKDLFKGIPEEMIFIMSNRQYYIDNEIFNKLNKYENHKELADKKRDIRSELEYMYSVCTTIIYENVIIELLKNFNCKSSKDGSNFSFNLNDASSREDLILSTENNNYKLELQRSNFMMYGCNFELKYSKINKDILDYIIDNRTGELSLLIMHFDQKNNKYTHQYDAIYSTNLVKSQKCGYYINNITLDNFYTFENLIKNFDNFDDVYNEVFI